jgi:hypothetical protein
LPFERRYHRLHGEGLDNPELRRTGASFAVATPGGTKGTGCPASSPSGAAITLGFPNGGEGIAVGHDTRSESLTTEMASMPRPARIALRGGALALLSALRRSRSRDPG